MDEAMSELRRVEFLAKKTKEEEARLGQSCGRRDKKKNASLPPKEGAR